MTAATTGRAGGVVLPLRPSAKSTAQHAPTRGRASDARPGEGPSHAAPAGPPAASGMAATEDDTGRGYAARLAGVQAAMSGASLLDAPPPSLAAVWAKHQASAEWYSAGVLRWPRYAYAVFHLGLVVLPFRFLEWAADSPPKLAATLATVLTVLWLLHVI